MPKILQRAEAPVEGQLAPAWPTYEAMNEEALRAADVALGRDVEQLAIDCGLSRRELNKQRERSPDDDHGGPASLGRQCLYRAALLLESVRQRFGPARCRPAARLIASACGVAIADPPAAAATATSSGLGLEILRLGIEANRELAEFLDVLHAAAADGRIDRAEVQTLLRELDDVLERSLCARLSLRQLLDRFPHSFGRPA